MRYENRTEPRMPPKPAPTLPQERGYYWAKWQIPDDDTEGFGPDQEHFVRTNTWEAVEVHADLGETGEIFRVSVAGVARTQSVENFIWAQPCKPIEPPKAKAGA